MRKYKNILYKILEFMHTELSPVQALKELPNIPKSK